MINYEGLMKQIKDDIPKWVKLVGKGKFRITEVSGQRIEIKFDNDEHIILWERESLEGANLELYYVMIGHIQVYLDNEFLDFGNHVTKRIVKARALDFKEEKLKMELRKTITEKEQHG